MREEWANAELKDICQIIAGTGFPKNIQGKRVGEYPFYKVGDISKNFKKGNRYLQFCDNYVDSLDIKNIHSKILPKGSIVFAKIGEALKLNRRAITSKESIIDNNAIGLKANWGIDNLYLFFFFQTIKLEKYSRATTVPSVRKSDIETIRIPLPPLPIQRAIVKKIETLFSNLDKGIANLKKAQEQLKIYRQAVLKKAFEGELTREWREKQTDLPSAEELLEQIKQERQKHYEQQLEDWKNVVKVWNENEKVGKKPVKPKTINNLQKVEELSDIGSLNVPDSWCCMFSEYLSSFITKGTTPKSSELFQSNGDIPFVKVYNLTFSGYLDFSINPTFVSNETHNNFLHRSKIYPNDILMNIVGPPLGKVSIVPNTYPEWNINQAIVRFRPYHTILPKYFALYLMMEWTIHQVSKKAKATAGQFNLTLEICRKIIVPVCSFEEQHQIVKEIETRLSVCDQVEQSIKEALVKSEALCQSILKKAFEGKLLSEEEIADCKLDDDYEPAIELLKKINKEKT